MPGKRYDRLFKLSAARLVLEGEVPVKEISEQLEEYGYPYLSIDHLKMGLIRSGNTDLTPEDDDELADYLWPIVREMVKTAVENGQNLIVEGCYIPPGWRADFSGDYLRSIDLVCLAMSDAYIDAHYEEIISHGSDIEGRLDDSGCTRDSLKEDNRCCIDSFAERGERVAVIQSDFEEETGALLREFEPCRTPSAIGRSRNRPSATRGTVIGASRNSYRSSAS